jgi:putative DNA primase/helicase
MKAPPPYEPASRDERAALAPAVGDPRTWPVSSWPDPQPLPEGLAPVAPFDYAMLPDRLRPWVQDVADRMQCPPDFVAVPMVAAAGNLIGRRCAIRPQAWSDWQEFPNLWGCIVGRPGMMKSPAMMAALAPVVRLEARALEEWTASQGQWRAEAEIAKARAEARKGEATKALRKNPDALVDVASFCTPDPDEAPILRRYTVASATVEALAEKLIENPRGLLVVRDELPGWLAGLDREDAAELRAFLMTGWNGKDGWTFDRIGRGHRRVPAVCLGVIGGAQPGPLGEYLRAAMRGGASDDGMLARFGLLVWPETGGKWKNVDRIPDGPAKAAAFAVFDELEALDPLARGAEQEEGEGPPFLRFTPEALEVFTDWRTDFEAGLRSGDLFPALESHLAKYRKLVPALALVFHLADGHSGPVGFASTLRALHWSTYLQTHARRCYGVAQSGEADTARRILERIAKGDLQREGFVGWNVWRPGWAGLADQKRVAAGLELLVELGQLEAWQEPTRGRAKTLYVINPKALPLASAKH